VNPLLTILKMLDGKNWGVHSYVPYEDRWS